MQLRLLYTRCVCCYFIEIRTHYLTGVGIVIYMMRAVHHQSFSVKMSQLIKVPVP